MEETTITVTILDDHHMADHPKPYQVSKQIWRIFTVKQIVNQLGSSLQNNSDNIETLNTFMVVLFPCPSIERLRRPLLDSSPFL